MKHANAIFKIRIGPIGLLITLTLGLFMQFEASAARGGGIDSGGGGAFLCRNVYTIEEPGAALTYVNEKSYFLDLWEAQFLRKLKIVRSDENEFTQMKNAFEKLRPFDSSLPDHLYNLAVKLDSEKTPTDEGIGLESPRDANSNYKMKSCNLVGMLFFDKDIGKISYDKEVYSVLASKTDVAAAMAHEAWYYYVRQQAKWNYAGQFENAFAKDSVKSRNLIGCLFSSDSNCLGVEQEKLRINNHLESSKQNRFDCQGQYTQMTYFSAPYPSMDAHFILHHLGSRIFKVGLRGAAFLTSGYQFSSSIGSLQEFDLANLHDLPYVFPILENSNSMAVAQIILLKSISEKSGSSYSPSIWYETGKNANGVTVPLFRPDQHIDTLTCKRHP